MWQRRRESSTPVAWVVSPVPCQSAGSLLTALSRVVGCRSISMIYVSLDLRNQKAKYAFITFVDSAAAAEAIGALDGLPWLALGISSTAAIKVRPAHVQGVRVSMLLHKQKSQDNRQVLLLHRGR